MEVIDKALDTLGKTPKQAIWVLLEKDLNVKINELPKNIQEFTEGLEKIFGFGYKFLDKLFCNYLEEATGKQFQENQTFCDRVQSLL